jgi:diadenosine tetraphosphate (Ap4A) HIT family hydrolase
MKEGEPMALDGYLERSPEGCVFCHRAVLDPILAETEHFFLLADHAPLVEGHLLIIPRVHYACYGAIPAALEDEFLALKRRVADFLAEVYLAPAFFEHGVFRQTVYHAHLHAMPFGPVNIDLPAQAADHGRHVTALADVRAWYAERGHYFYLEQPPRDGAPMEAAVFPPREAVYFRVLGQLREASGHVAPWHPQPLRRLTGKAKMRSVAANWQSYTAGHPPR